MDTTPSFRILGLPAEPFAPFFTMSDAELAAQGAVRRIANDRVPGYPCRVSLTDSPATGVAGGAPVHPGRHAD